MGAGCRLGLGCFDLDLGWLNFPALNLPFFSTSKSFGSGGILPDAPLSWLAFLRIISAWRSYSLISPLISIICPSS